MSGGAHTCCLTSVSPLAALLACFLGFSPLERWRETGQITLLSHPFSWLKNPAAFSLFLSGSVSESYDSHCPSPYFRMQASNHRILELEGALVEESQEQRVALPHPAAAMGREPSPLPSPCPIPPLTE